MARFARSWGSDENATFRGNEVSVAWAAAPPLFARSFTIEVELSAPAEANGVILASGSWFGGWSFYLDQGRPVAYHAFSQRPEDQFMVSSETSLNPGHAKLQFQFEYDGGGIGKGGTLTISHEGELLAQGRVERTISIPADLGDNMDTGRDTGVPVTKARPGQTRFESDIIEVRIQTDPPEVLPF